MDKTLRVLYFLDYLSQGGIQSFILQHLRRFDRDRLRVEVLTLDDGVDYPMEHTLRAEGFTLHKLRGVWIRKPWDYLPYRAGVRRFLETHRGYDILHLHASSKHAFLLEEAARQGIPVRIAHSHNTGFQSANPLYRLGGNLLKSRLGRASTHYFACSEPAGAWLFGGERVRRGEVTIVPNAIDAGAFRYCPETRSRMRREMGLVDAFVVGHIGRFSEQKNHPFLLEIFARVQQVRPGSTLLLIGSGEGQRAVAEQVEALGLGRHVRFCGHRDDCAALLQAMDAFVLPSRFEGLGIVLLEAQAAGLPCFTSAGVVPAEAKVTDLLDYIPLDQPADHWAERILAPQGERRDTWGEIRAAGYDIEAAAKQLEALYFQLAEAVAYEP